MKNKNTNGTYSKKSEGILYIAIIIAGAAAAFFTGARLLSCMLIAALVAVWIIYAVYDKVGLSRMMKYLESFAPKLKSAETESMAGFPFPVAVLNKTGKISWYNTALEETLRGELLFQRDVKTIVPDFEIDKVRGDGFRTKAKLCGKLFDVLAHRISSYDDDTIFVYFIDISESEEIAEKYENERPVEMIISVDNFNEVIKNAPDKDKPIIGSEIEKILISFAAEVGGVIKKTEREKYILFITNAALDEMIKRKFAVLDAVREIKPGLSIVPTLSIGVGTDGTTLGENDSFAAAALDMALGRGGDQVVIRDGVSFRYYGGKTREIEKRTKVRARVVAHAMRELIAKSEQVIVMGHKSADIDCIGAGIGLVSYARRNGTRAYMVINSGDKTVTDTVAEVRRQEIMENAFIRYEYAREIINSKTLLIVVDTHKQSLAEFPELLKQTEQIAVIDHHRRAADYIQNPVLMYHEPYASSTCEMVAEMIQYIVDKKFLTPVEAKAMYAGIFLDTKGFSFKTGARTLEAAAFLRRSGADPVEVKKLFRADLGAYLKRTALVSSAAMYKGGIAIAVSPEKLSQSIVAQAADELVNIAGIDTSFVVSAGEGGKTIISARSAGEVNVQLILEKLGGGGHMTIAGAQLENVGVGDAVNMLKSVIDEYLSNTK